MSATSQLMARATSEQSEPRNIWGYEPSLAGNIIFAVLFLLLTAGHLFIRIRHKSPAAFFNPLLAGGIFEIIGYCVRVAARGNTSSVGPYAIQALFLLLAPVLFAATCYMTLGRTIYAIDAQAKSRIPLRWLTKTFVTGDIVCFVIQAAGGSMQSIHSNEQIPNIGKWIVMVGLIIQVIIFGIYASLAVDFHVRLRKSPSSSSQEASIHWQQVMCTIYAASVLIISRNIVRIVEFEQGYTGWIITHEFMLFIFDGALMALLLLILLIWHPARLLQGRLKNYKADTRKPGIMGVGDKSEYSEA